MWTSSELEKQLADGRFKLFLEPHYNVDTMKIDAVETNLVYLNDENNMENASTFLPTLEEKDLVSILDMWTLNEACKIQRKLVEYQTKILPIYVNLSAWTVCNPYNVYDIVLTCKDFSLPDGAISFGLTSTTPYLSIYGLNKSISFLQQKGMQVMLNRFGSIGTTLALFSDISFDRLQIDENFLKKAMKSQRIDVILHHIVDLSINLKMHVIFDGIDTLNEYQYIKSLGGIYARGAFFGGNLTPEELIETDRGNDKR